MSKMRIFEVVLVMLVPLILPNSTWAAQELVYRIMNTVSEDYINFYSVESLGKLAIGTGVAGVLANTSADEEIQDWYQESLRSNNTDSFSKVVKQFGDGSITVPLYIGVALLGELTRDTNFGSTTGRWGRKSLRVLWVGVPPMLLLQRVLGASRPDEGDSHWQSFNDDNGVSGHSFMGAVPFLTAAEMTDNSYMKYTLYLASTLAGWSRINDNDHYLSQAALGWWMAYLSVKSTDRTDRRKVIISPAIMHNGATISITFLF
jgi:hypothetical protein